MTFLVLPAQVPLYKIGNPILLTPFVGQTAFVAEAPGEERPATSNVLENLAK